MTQTALFAKTKVLLGMLEDKEDGLPAWKRKLIYDHLEEAQDIMTTPDRRGVQRRVYEASR